ncbi:hypothetical protein LTR95_011788 [Oleoguttula sp. CCFEE 5521]
MICTTCLRRLARSSRLPAKRPYSTPAPSVLRPAATSQPDHAQPFSTSPAASTSPAPAAKAAPSRIPSSVPAGTLLKGLNYIKGKQDPVALEDQEYPEWLWSVLEKAQKSDGAAAGGDENDLFSKSKKQRQRAAKSLRKRALLHPEDMIAKVPLYEQTVDLPKGDGSVRGALEAGEAREGLTKAMRGERRRVIKEKNFLKAMG